MAECRATMALEGSEVILACSLAEHEKVLGFHYDKRFGPNGLEWRPGLQPASVMSTRTTPPRRAAAAAALHTTNFEVVKI